MKQNTFGKTLKHYREQRKLSLRQLASQAYLFFTNIHKIEQGTYTCGTLTAEKLAMALKLNGYTREAFLKSAHTTAKRKIKANIPWIGTLIEKAAFDATTQYLSTHKIKFHEFIDTHRHDIVITLLDGRKYAINITAKSLS